MGSAFADSLHFPVFNLGSTPTSVLCSVTVPLIPA